MRDECFSLKTIILAVVVFFNIGVWYAVSNLFSAASNLRSQRLGNWPDVPCTVDQTPIIQTKGKKSRVMVMVSYNVSNAQYTAIKVYNTVGNQYSAEDYTTFQSKYAALEGKSNHATCYYNPSKPSDAVLELHSDANKEKGIFTAAAAVAAVGGSAGLYCIFKTWQLEMCPCIARSKDAGADNGFKVAAPAEVSEIQMRARAPTENPMITRPRVDSADPNRMTPARLQDLMKSSPAIGSKQQPTGGVRFKRAETSIGAARPVPEFPSCYGRSPNTHPRGNSGAKNPKKARPHKPPQHTQTS